MHTYMSTLNKTNSLVYYFFVYTHAHVRAHTPWNCYDESMMV